MNTQVKQSNSQTRPERTQATFSAPIARRRHAVLQDLSGGSRGSAWALCSQAREKGLLRCPNRVVLRENLETGNETKKKGPESKFGSIIIPPNNRLLQPPGLKNTTYYAGQETSLSSPRRSPRHQRWDRS